LNLSTGVPAAEVHLMRFLSFCLVVACILLLPNRVRAQLNSATGAAARANAMPFRLESGFLIEVEGRIGQLKSLKFILDTGATHSFIDRRIARRLPLTLSHRKVFNFDSFVSVDSAEFADVHLGPIQMRNVSMMVSDLAKSSELAGHADAIIGLDLLTTAASLDIYYDSKRVVLIPRDINEQAAHERGKPECFTVEAFIQGHPVRLVLDTGIAGILLYEDRVRKRIPNVRFRDEIKGALGRLQGKTARLDGFRVGGHESNVEVFLMSGPRVDQLPGIDGYLGISPLKAKRIELDFEGRAIRWQ
jgi:predicted aspartyl protease